VARRFVDHEIKALVIMILATASQPNNSDLLLDNMAIPTETKGLHGTQACSAMLMLTDLATLFRPTHGNKPAKQPTNE
jgi:hypothetical protein